MSTCSVLAGDLPNLRFVQPETEMVILTDSVGRIVAVPRATLEAVRRAGHTRMILDIDLGGGADRAAWLTVTQAAEQHLADLSPTLDAEDLDAEERRRLAHLAQVKISAACGKGIITCDGNGRRRRIEPNSFAAWRLKEREKMLR